MVARAEIARQYAQAAYQYTTEGWLSDLNKVRDQLATAPGLLEALDDVTLPFSGRQARLDSAMPQGVRPDVRNFLYVLLREGHLGLLSDVIADLTRLSTRGPQAHVAHVISAVPLTPEEREAFRQRLQVAYGELVDIHYRVDASILGGAIVQVGDKVIDGSIAGKLNALRDRLAAVR
jgi:F-type H+-transporting ATPase subunit delta